MRVAAILLPLALLSCAHQAPEAAPYTPAPPAPSAPPPPAMTWIRADGQPGMVDQGNADLATCRAVAMNAANQIQIPPSIQSFDMGPTIAIVRQRQTQDVNFQACMRQRGYKLVPVSQK